MSEVPQYRQVGHGQEGHMKVYRGTLLIIKKKPLRPYRRPMSGWAFCHERGNPLQASGARTKCLDFSNMNAVLEIRNSKPM
jgi:hypothetical protein